MELLTHLLIVRVLWKNELGVSLGKDNDVIMHELHFDHFPLHCLFTFLRGDWLPPTPDST